MRSSLSEFVLLSLRVTPYLEAPILYAIFFFPIIIIGPDGPQVIIARTDSAQVLGMEEAVTRLKLASDAGADVCFIEGVRTGELLESTVAALAPKPVSLRSLICIFFTALTFRHQVLVNVISGGLTPSFTTSEAESMGAKIISASGCLNNKNIKLLTAF